MVEYGGAIKHGPAGQVPGGSGGGPIGGGTTDLFAPVGRFVGDTVHTLSTMSPVELLLVGAAIFVGLLILRRVL